MKYEQLNGGLCKRSFGYTTNSWCEAIFKRTSDEASGTKKPQLVNGSPIGHAYTNFGS